MYDWNDFQYILALEEAGTMKRAAELLGANATTVSRRIKKVTEVCGFPIFVATKEGAWRLTDQGQALHKLALEFRSSMEHLDIEALQYKSQEVCKITSLEFVLEHFLAPNLDRVQEFCPDAEINLLASDKRLSLAYGEADLALRFGRPVDGQLVASKLTEIQFHIWAPDGEKPKDWVGFDETLDWTPEMRWGLEFFGKPPSVRVTSFATAMRAAVSLECGVIGPAVMMKNKGNLAPVHGVAPISREIWSIIHESRRSDKRLHAVRDWAKSVILKAQAESQDYIDETPSNLRRLA